jgi:hypothetical protein
MPGSALPATRWASIDQPFFTVWIETHQHESFARSKRLCQFDCDPVGTLRSQSTLTPLPLLRWDQWDYGKLIITFQNPGPSPAQGSQFIRFST